jgi:hypothetical protein
MSTRFTNDDHYASDVPGLWAMISEQDYWTQKYQTTGATHVSVDRFESAPDALTVATTRDVPADLPGFAKKIVGDTNRVTQVERWTRSGEGAHCDITIEVRNVPGGTRGVMDMRPDGDGARWTADFEIKIGIPLVGGKFERLMHDETAGNFAREKEFNDVWLASH